MNGDTRLPAFVIGTIGVFLIWCAITDRNPRAVLYYLTVPTGAMPEKGSGTKWAREIAKGTTASGTGGAPKVVTV